MNMWNVSFTNPGGLVFTPSRFYVARREPPVVIVDQPLVGFQTAREAEAFVIGMCYGTQAASRLGTVIQHAPDIVVRREEFVVVKYDGEDKRLYAMGRRAPEFADGPESQEQPSGSSTGL